VVIEGGAVVARVSLSPTASFYSSAPGSVPGNGFWGGGILSRGVRGATGDGGDATPAPPRLL